MYTKCTFNYFYYTMDHRLLFCYCIQAVFLYYAHIVLYLSSHIIFSVPIELFNYKFIMCCHVLAVAPPQNITPRLNQTRN